MKLLLDLLILTVFLQSADAAERPLPSFDKVEEIGVYDVERLNKILTTELKEFSDFEVQYAKPKYAVKLYRVTYRSMIPEQNNRPVTASGLVAVPQNGAKEMPVVSYQHGTVFTKTAVPSHPEESMETRLMIANFAGQGYLVMAADYFGKGLSKETDSYLVKASTQQACLDLYFAAQRLSQDLGVKWFGLYVSGWSQGGWATLAFLNRLEEIGVNVEAAGIASGPSDMYATLNGWIHAPRELDASYLPAALCLQIHAVEAYYSLPGLAAAAIRPEYQQTARDFYLNNMTFAEAFPKLPSTAAELYQDAFLEVNSPLSSRYWELASLSQVYRWRAATPMRTYFGQIDEVTTPYMAKLPVEFQQAVGGAEARVIDAGEHATHRGTFLYAMADQQQWFAEIRKTAGSATLSTKETKANKTSTRPSGSKSPAVP